jgi:hypothetical protein
VETSKRTEDVACSRINGIPGAKVAVVMALNE